MNGVDWEKVRDKYAQLLPYVADRYSLTYILGEIIGELSNSHTYVNGGDFPDLHPINVGLLGADFEADPASGFYRFKKIYPGENWNPQRAITLDRARNQCERRRLPDRSERPPIAGSAKPR